MTERESEREDFSDRLAYGDTGSDNSVNSESAVDQLPPRLIPFDVTVCARGDMLLPCRRRRCHPVSKWTFQSTLSARLVSI